MVPLSGGLNTFKKNKQIAFVNSTQTRSFFVSKFRLFFSLQLKILNRFFNPITILDLKLHDEK
jgi:hypothetical protein